VIALEYQLQKFHDFDLLRHFLIMHKETGSCIFYHPFKKDRVSSDLISGFISAMSSMYGAFTGEGKQESVESLKYQGMNLDGYSGSHVMGILISEGSMKTSFDLKDFIASFESEYGDVLEEWRGFVKIFDHKWIVGQLLDAIGYYANLQFEVAIPKPEKQQYRKVVDFLRLVRNKEGRFLIRKVLPGLKKFLNTSEAYVLDILMMMQRDGVIANAPIDDYLSDDAGKIISESMSAGVISEDSLGESMDVQAHTPQEAVNAPSEPPQKRVTVNEDGTYSFKMEMSLDVIMRHSGDAWLREIISDAVELETGRRIEITNPQYAPVECDSKTRTIWIDVVFKDEDE
jgi:hypothetical protein